LVDCIHYVEGRKATPARSSDRGDALCVRATGPCCVVSIRSTIARLAVERKPSKYDRKKKLITSLTNRKCESDLKCVSILPKRNGWRTFVTVCSCFIGCVAIHSERLAYTQIYTAVSVVQPRRLLLSTGKTERLYALVLVSHIQ